MKRVAVSLVLLTLNSLAIASAEEEVHRASIVQLLANPERFEGKLVEIQGFVRLEFEGDAIYLHKEDYEHGLYSNGMWLGASECKRMDGTTFDAGYAMVVGRFTSQRRGHMGLWSGAIEDVQTCYKWPPHRRDT